MQVQEQGAQVKAALGLGSSTLGSHAFNAYSEDPPTPTQRHLQVAGAQDVSETPALSTPISTSTSLPRDL